MGARELSLPSLLLILSHSLPHGRFPAASIISGAVFRKTGRLTFLIPVTISGVTLRLVCSTEMRRRYRKGKKSSMDMITSLCSVRGLTLSYADGSDQ